MPRPDRRRHDIDDRARAIIGLLLSGWRGQWGGIAEDDRRFINAVLRVLRIGAKARLAADAHGMPVRFLVAGGAEAVVPSKSNRRDKREIDLHIYKQRHVIENAFEKVKRRRGTAVRYCKRPSSFISAVRIRCLSLWLHIL